MCVVSMITDNAREKWPSPYILPQPFDIYKLPIPSDKIIISRKEWEEYQKLKKLAEEYDARTGQPHCEKPDVTAWEQSLIDAGCIKDDNS